MPFLNGIFGRQAQQQPQGQQPAQQQTPNQQQQQRPQGNNGGGGQPAQQQQQPNNSQFQNNGGGQTPPQGQQSQQSNGGGQQSANPLDNWMQLMTPKQQQQQQQQPKKMFGDLTPDKMKEMVGQTNFAQNIDPELAQKALGGDMQAFTQVLNSVAQNVFSSSLQMSQGMVEHGVGFGTEQITGSLDSRIRDFQVRNQNSQNPALQHPIGQALLGSVKQQLAAANPRSTPQEIQTQAEQMFQDFAQMLVPQQNNQQANSSQTPPAQDWSLFLQDSPTQ